MTGNARSDVVRVGKVAGCNGFFDRSGGFVAWRNVCSPAFNPKLISANG
jgi:hypothetical protein